MERLIYSYRLENIRQSIRSLWWTTWNHSSVSSISTLEHYQLVWILIVFPLYSSKQLSVCHVIVGRDNSHPRLQPGEEAVSTYSQVISIGEGQTKLLKHAIKTGDAKPIHQPTRRLPYHQRNVVQRMVKDVLQQGINCTVVVLGHLQ